MPDPPGAKQYSPAEVDEILKRALARQQETGTSREDILAAAREVGLDDAAVLAAAAEVESERSATEVSARLREERADGIKRHAMLFAVVNAGLFVLNLATNMATVTEGVPRWWFLYPLIVWAVVLGVQAGRWKMNPDPSAAEVRDALDAQRKADAQKAFETSVEQGVHEVLQRVQSIVQAAPKVRVQTDEAAATTVDEAAVEARGEDDHEEER